MYSTDKKEISFKISDVFESQVTCVKISNDC